MITKKEVVAFEFKNKKQSAFYDSVMLSVARKLLKRIFFYGGGMRGGKTFVCLFILVQLARLFPRSRWHIIRSSFTDLEATTIPSMEKLIGTEGEHFKWKRNKSNYHVLFANGSKIFFKSENLGLDPELTWMLGLETNGIFLEQMEGLSKKLLDRSIERTGSWYLDPMPIPLILGTFNPTPKWVKSEIYDKWKEGKLPDTWHFEEALPSDNPFVTEDQWSNWLNMDPISRAQLLEAQWTFLADAKTFAYSYNEKKHIINVEEPGGAAFMTPRPGLPLKVYFDFNVDPMTALICQNDGMKWAKVYAEYRLMTSDIFEICERILNDWGEYYLVVSGDASGRARSALTRGNKSFVKLIKQEMKLKDVQMQFPSVNPSVRNTRVLLNSLFHKHPAFFISSKCQFLKADLESVKVDDDGEIDKKKDAAKTHLLDNLRYFTWQNFRKFLDLKGTQPQ